MTNDAEIVRLYTSGKSCITIAGELGYKSHVTVLNRLRKLGVSRRNRRDCMLGTNNARQHSLDETFFRTIDTEHKAYQLGLLYADGWINEKSGTVGISLVDKDVVEQLKSDIKSSIPITERPPKKETHNTSYSLVFGSKTMIEDLKGHGCTERKSLTLDFPTTVPDHLIHHFVRGYWDGDGFIQIDCKNNLRFGMCGSQRFIQKVSDVLSKNGIFGADIETHGSIYRLNFSGNRQAFRFRCFAFRDATIWMYRKKVKLFSILPKYRVPIDLQPSLDRAAADKNYPCKIDTLEVK